MTPQRVPTTRTASTEQRKRSRYARVAWLGIVALQLASFVPLLPAYLPLADHPCHKSCLLTALEARLLSDAGIAPTLYVGGLLIVTVVNLVITSAVAGILFVRRAFDPMALITAYVVLILPTTILLNQAPIETSTTQQTTAFNLPPLLDSANGLLQAGAIYGMFLLFPSGRFVPRWSWVLLPGFLVFTMVFSQSPEVPGALVLGWPFFFGSAAACIGYRYWQVSTASERQQTKWVLVGLLTFLLASQAYWLPTFTPLGTTVYNPLSYLGYQIVLPVVPITVFIAVQRYHLYDVDRLINRALVYGALTLILTCVFVGLVIGLQALLGALISQDNRIAIVSSTLAIAALVRPLRGRLQTSIDRRFYRQKYDAQETLAAFSATVRHEVNLEQMQAQLLAVVRETMQPSQVSLWVRPPDQPSAEHR